MHPTFVVHLPITPSPLTTPSHPPSLCRHAVARRARASRQTWTAQFSAPGGGYSDQSSSGGGYSGQSSSSGGYSGQSSSGGGGMQRVEYIIRPDGRVEELVSGVKGSDCVKVTEEINAKLGKVISTETTPEYFEKNVVVNENIETNTDTTGFSQW